MADYTTVFGVKPVGEVDTSFSKSIPKAENTKVDTSVAATIAHTVESLNQSLTLSNEANRDAAEDEAEKTITSLMQSFTETTDYSEVAKRLNVTNKLSNQALRNLSYAAAREQLRQKYKGRLARKAIDAVLEGKFGTAHPLRKVETERVAREDAALKAATTKKAKDLDDALKAGIQFINPVTRQLDKDKTVKAYQALRVMDGGIAVVGNSVSSGSEPSSGVFRAHKIHEFTKAQEILERKYSLQLHNLLYTISNSRNNKEIAQAKEKLGNAIANINLEAYALLKGGKSFQPLSVKERAFVTGPALSTWNALKGKLGLSEKDLQNDAVIKTYTDVTKLVAEARFMGSKLGRMIMMLGQTPMHDSVKSLLLENIEGFNSQLKNIMAATGKGTDLSATDDATIKSFENLLNGMDDQSPVEVKKCTGLITNNLCKNISVDKAKKISSDDAAKVVNTAAQIITSETFTDPENRKEFIKNMSSPGAMEFIKKMEPSVQKKAVRIFLNESIRSGDQQLMELFEGISSIRRTEFDQDIKNGLYTIDNEGKLKINLPSSDVDPNRIKAIDSFFDSMVKFHGFTEESKTMTALQFRKNYLRNKLKEILAITQRVKPYQSPRTLKDQTKFLQKMGFKVKRKVQND
tara:strand:+ start:22559 stop:24460 length:1902 start_codon:yes stop_codon:yes gene_type:complete